MSVVELNVNVLTDIGNVFISLETSSTPVIRTAERTDGEGNGQGALLLILHSSSITPAQWGAAGVWSGLHSWIALDRLQKRTEQCLT